MSNNKEIQTAIQLFKKGEIEQSRAILDSYITAQPNDINANLLSAAISAAELDFPEVVTKCRKILVLEPGNIRANYNAAVASDKLKNHDDVFLFASNILQVEPDNAYALMFQAKALFNLSRFDECIKLLEGLSHERLMSFPDLPIILAESYMSISKNEKAILVFKSNIAANINPARCFHNIGIIEDRRGNVDESIRAYQATVSIVPDALNSNFNLAFLLNKKGHKVQALKYINKCFEAHDTPKVRKAYVDLLSTAKVEHVDKSAEKFIYEVISDKSTDAQTLSSLVMGLLKHNDSVVSKLFIKANGNDYSGFIAILKRCINEVADNELLQLFFVNLPITNYEFEIFSKMFRRALLLEFFNNKWEGNDASNLCSAIAIRCYIDGYVFTVTEDESKALAELVNSLKLNQSLSDKTLISLVAMYVSLYEIYKTHGINIEFSRNDSILGKLVTLQLDDNLVEEELRGSIEAFSEIKDKTSLAVQSQYESNPYPVWQILSIRQPESIIEIMQKITAYTNAINLDFDCPDILVAGCGTGSHVIQTAMRIKHKSLTTLDLSKRSLAFAKRKAGEYGFDEINFKQLDILQVSTLENKFDIIESVGVLHHMQDPLEGFKCLVDILKPGGLMNIGLYSKLGRRYIIKAKSVYDEPDRHVSDDEIRQIRLDIMASDNEQLVTNLSSYKDYYSLHDCRDLIFHENENNYNISDLSKLICDAGLEFIGFDLCNSSVLPDFQKMFPEKNAYSILSNWGIYEEKYQDTFASMYVFWCRRKA